MKKAKLVIATVLLTAILLVTFAPTARAPKPPPPPPEYTWATETPSELTAVIVDPFEFLKRVWSNPELIANLTGYLESNGYSVEYAQNEVVTIEYIETSLEAGVIIFKGHGGYDRKSRQVVLVSGERWNESKIDEVGDIYYDEYQAGMIYKVKIKVGVEGAIVPFFAYRPSLITYAYGANGNPGEFGGPLPNSLVYTGSCSGLKNPTMGNAFLGAGAGAYIGWTSMTTGEGADGGMDLAFDLFSQGYCVEYAVWSTPRDHGATLKYVGEPELGTYIPY